MLDIVMGLMIGVGLSAACGFRVFVPLLGVSVANMAGYLTLSPGFEWIGSWPALIAFATATVSEICAYCVPWVDNLMDALATPTAIGAGSILTASQVDDISPLLQWSLAIIAGGGASGLVQASTVVLRLGSTGTTGGFGNFLVATFELGAAIVVTLLAIVAPVLCLLVMMAIAYLFMKRMAKARSRPMPQSPGA